MSEDEKIEMPESVDYGSKEHLYWGQVTVFNQTLVLQKVHDKLLDPKDSLRMSMAFTMMSMHETSRSILLLCRNNVRDTYALSRILMDLALNLGYYSVKEGIVDKAIDHAKQKSFRDLFRSFDTDEFKIISYLDDLDLTIPDNIKDALEAFTDEKGREIRFWSPESKDDVFKKISKISAKHGEGIGKVLTLALFSIYRHASEIIHGTMFGTFYGIGYTSANEKLTASDEEYQAYINRMNSYLLQIISLLLETCLKIVNDNFPIEELVKEAHENNRKLIELSITDKEMKEKDPHDLLSDYPMEVKFEDIKEYDQFDERMSAVGTIVANSIGVNEGFVEFCPDNEPPTTEEILTWIWACSPDLNDKIKDYQISEEFSRLLSAYESDSMEDFWEYMN